jgi:Uma2 family endonuclease
MSSSTRIAEPPVNLGEVPPLEPGDRLTRAEFERRYEAMPRLRKAELIEGVVYMPSPVRLRLHSRPHLHLATWLGAYEAGTPGTVAADNSTVRLDLDNEPQPDLLLLIDPSMGGQARVSDDDYVEGAPELVAEIASSTVSYDLNAKLNVYRRNGVREYVVWRVLDREIDWFILREGRYEELSRGSSGLCKSEIFPGLWLDLAAMVRGELADVLGTLRQGLATSEHAAFADRLKALGRSTEIR